jgi:hypothetical protein
MCAFTVRDWAEAGVGAELRLGVDAVGGPNLHLSSFPPPWGRRNVGMIGERSR